MAYRLSIKPAAERDLRALSASIRRRVDAIILHLAENPRPHNACKLKGRTNMWRIRVGDYRVVYSVQDDVLLVLVVRVRHRREAYR